MTQDPAAPGSFSGPFSAPSRRDLMAGGAAVVGVMAAGQALAQPAAPKKARWRRWNVASPQGQKALASYAKAVEIMLGLPPEHPNNWYNHALTHTVDCPHGNWWFVVWHRGYVGWFEQTVRQLSGDPDFAFPYWDWTASPRVPAAMFEGVLNPNNRAYIQSLDAFNKAFGPVLETFWAGLSQAQNQQLLIRGLRFPADLLFDIGPKGGPMFFAPPNARGSTPQNPGFDTITNNAVSSWMLNDALSPRDFIGFASPKSNYHSSITGFGVMEGQPHNKVHNCVGGIWTDDQGNTTYGDGFMQSNLSPVDPLFFLHHANIDRIWDVWTRKQQGFGYPTLPADNPSYIDPKGDLVRWQSEPFLFFTDAGGAPLPPEKQKAKAYQTIGEFDYDYEPGSGENVVPKLGAPKLKAAAAPTRYTAKLKTPTGTSLGAGDVAVPSAVLAQAAKPEGTSLLATITVDLPPFEHGGDLAVVLNTPEGQPVTPNSPGFVTTLSMFGRHLVTRPVTFTVPLSPPLAKLAKARGTLEAAAPSGLNIRLVRLSGKPLLTETPHAHHADAGATTATPQVLDIVINAN
ncbi:tyrosinase family protein [Caulobacter radicis]|uniref:Tyrosinase n=1 Tax=Caulobacter radicis TaxID=2172650 RepID=A0A2T9JKS7_9CAUL|nr:tyrosinase family protein [Caulobacter radicis]PVM84301.1 tyrosinase [Caulobacter radicis]